MTREELSAWHQAYAVEAAEFARWVARKADEERRRIAAGAPDIYVVRLNQLKFEADLAAAHYKTARLLMGLAD